MPKLENVPMKSMFGLQVDKENDDVIYNDEKHCYLTIDSSFLSPL